MNRCDQENRLTPFLLGDLSEPEAAEFRRHLAGCAACQEKARELSPVLKSLAAALARDRDQNPRFDMRHQLDLLSVPAERTHRVLDWMAHPRPWLVAAACALIVTGLTYSVVKMSITRQGFRQTKTDEVPILLGPSPTPWAWLAQHVSPKEQAQPRAKESLGARRSPFDERQVGEYFNSTPDSGSMGNRNAERNLGDRNLGEEHEADKRKSGVIGGALGGLGDTDFKTPQEGVDPSGASSARAAGQFAARRKLSGAMPMAGVSVGQAVASGPNAFKGLGAEQAEDKPAGASPGRARALHVPSASASGLADVLQESGGSGSPALPVTRRTCTESQMRPKPAAWGMLGKSETAIDEAGDSMRPRAGASSGKESSRQEVAAAEGKNEPIVSGGVFPDSRSELSGRKKDNADAVMYLWSDSDSDSDTKAINGLAYRGELSSSDGVVAQYGVDTMKVAADKPVAAPIKPKVTTSPSAEPAALRPIRRPALAFNPFVATAENHFSTFSIDVNTASYTLTRQAIRSGALPDPEVVRTEEILNAFDYGDAPPDRATFRVYVEGAPSAFGAPGLTLLRIGVKGKRQGREEQRPAMLTFLIDTSGSMAQPDRIGRARTALRLLLDQLAPADKLQIVSFDDKARVVLPPTAAARKTEILKAFDRLQCNGSTNLEDGMRRAYEQAARAFVPGGENRVILISDGVANLGADNAQDILREVEAFRKQGVTCSVFGVGEGTYNDAMLEDLANKGEEGVYRFLDSDEEVKRVFVDDLAATLNNIATDVKIQVEWSAAVRRFRQLGYERRALTAGQFRDDTVEAGEVGSGQAVTALYELDLSPAAKQASLGTVRVRYRRVDTGAIEEIAQEISPEMLTSAIGATRPQFRLAVGAAAFAERLRGSPYVAREYADVARLLRPVAQELSLDPRVKELLALVEAAEAMAK